MHFDFVDIGTCDFDTSLDSMNDLSKKVLLIDPLDFYLDRLPTYSNVIKDCVAIGKSAGEVDIYYLPLSVIDKYNFPWWIKGCSSIGYAHPALVSMLTEKNLDVTHIKIKKVNIITFDMLCLKHEITSIGNLKIDTEGHEQYILPDVLKKIKAGFEIRVIMFENQEYLGNKTFLDQLILEFFNVGYRLVHKDKQDVIIEKI